jgi:hypothetical protein
LRASRGRRRPPSTVLERAAFGRNRHREERSDAAIQESSSALRSLDRFACARDDNRGSTQMQFALAQAPAGTAAFRSAPSSLARQSRRRFVQPTVSENQNKCFLPTGISAIMANCVKAEILMSNTVPIQKRGATRLVGADGRLNRGIRDSGACAFGPKTAHERKARNKKAVNSLKTDRSTKSPIQLSY